MTEVGLVLLVLAIVMLVIANLIERKTMKNRVINRIVKCFKRTLPINIREDGEVIIMKFLIISSAFYIILSIFYFTVSDNKVLHYLIYTPLILKYILVKMHKKRV